MQMLIFFYTSLLLVPCPAQIRRVREREGGLSWGQMSSDRRPRTPSSPWDEVVCFQRRTLTLTFIYPREPAASLWQADGNPITTEPHDNKKPIKKRKKEKEAEIWLQRGSHSGVTHMFNGQRQRRVLGLKPAKKLVNMEMLRRKLGIREVIKDN